MPDYVALVKVNEADAFDVAQYVDGLQKSAAARERQIDLSEVAGHDSFGIESLPGKNHLHLLGSAVLRLVENNEAVIQGATAHERQRRYFDRIALHQLLYLLGIQ